MTTKGFTPIGPNKNSKREITLHAGSFELTFPENLVVAYYSTYFAEVYPFALINRGDTVLDLGASFGDFTLLASSRVGPQGEIIAVEPDPEAFSFLRKNVIRNGIKNVRLVPAAITDGSSSTKMLEVAGTASRLSDKGSTRTQAVTMDDLLDEHSRADVIKMDIEGEELRVFRAQGEAIRKARAVFVETHDPKSDREIRGLLQLAGFKLSQLGRGSLVSRAILNIIQHPHEFIDAEVESKFYSFKSIPTVFNGKNACNSRSGLSLIIATK